MKALVLEKYGEFEYKDVGEPSRGGDDVLIKVKACAISGNIYGDLSLEQRQSTGQIPS